MTKMTKLIIAGFLVLVVGGQSVYTVEQWQKGILFRLGEIVMVDVSPGLHFKLPFVNNVLKFDGRIQTLDAKPERYLTKEKKNLIVDSFVKWKIDDVGKYYTAMGGSADRANIRLSQIIKDGLRSQFGNRTITEVVSGERQAIMDSIKESVSEQATNFGLIVVDVRLKRIDLPEQVSGSVYERMEAERARIAMDLRSKGAEQAEIIRADAERERAIIQSNAYRKAEVTRGEGDAEASEIYAKSYTKNPEFYAFYRSMNSYKKAFGGSGDLIVLEPTSDYFRYFNNQGRSR